MDKVCLLSFELFLQGSHDGFAIDGILLGLGLVEADDVASLTHHHLLDLKRCPSLRALSRLTDLVIASSPG
jgi:hypothetical protein